MSEAKADRSGQQASEPAGEEDVKDLLTSSNWEVRLEAARAQREKVLARRQNADRRRNPDPPGMTADREEPPSALPPSAREKAAAGSTPQDAVPDAAPSEAAGLPVVPPPRSRRTVLIAAACFMCLGFGLAIGFGMRLGVDRWSGAEAEAVAALPVEDRHAGDPQDDDGVSGAPQEADAADAPSDTDAAPDVTGPATAPDVTPPDAGSEPESPPDLAGRLAASGAPVDAVRLYLYAPDSVPKEALDARVGRLNETGLPVAEIRRLSLRISAPHIRFYNAGDATVAGALADDLGIEVRDFSAQQSGALGRIEVWLDGTSTRRAGSGRSQRRTQPTLIDDLRDLRDRLFPNVR